MLRNLISNALKVGDCPAWKSSQPPCIAHFQAHQFPQFTDAGGTVSLRAAFVPGLEPGKTLPRHDADTGADGPGPGGSSGWLQRVLAVGAAVARRLCGDGSSDTDDAGSGQADAAGGTGGTGGGGGGLQHAYEAIRVRAGAFDGAGGDLAEAAVVLGTLRLVVQVRPGLHSHSPSR